jgi:hypothetical protein
MKAYIIINGTTAIIIKRSSMEEARALAINACDVSKEIIVREVVDCYNYLDAIQSGVNEL